MKFKFLEHTADVKFQAFGKNIEELFENSALALKETICGKMKVKAGIKHRFNIECRAEGLRETDYETMLYSFLEELLYLLDAESFLFSKVKVRSFQKTGLEIIVWGDKTSNYNFNNPVKAVTYNEMFVKQEKGKWTSQVVLDV